MAMPIRACELHARAPPHSVKGEGIVACGSVQFKPAAGPRVARRSFIETNPDLTDEETNRVTSRTIAVVHCERARQRPAGEREAWRRLSGGAVTCPRDRTRGDRGIAGGDLR